MKIAQTVALSYLSIIISSFKLSYNSHFWRCCFSHILQIAILRQSCCWPPLDVHNLQQHWTGCFYFKQRKGMLIPLCLDMPSAHPVGAKPQNYTHNRGTVWKTHPYMISLLQSLDKEKGPISLQIVTTPPGMAGTKSPPPTPGLTPIPPFRMILFMWSSYEFLWCFRYDWPDFIGARHRWGRLPLLYRIL